MTPIEKTPFPAELSTRIYVFFLSFLVQSRWLLSRFLWKKDYCWRAALRVSADFLLTFSKKMLLFNNEKPGLQRISFASCLFGMRNWRFAKNMSIIYIVCFPTPFLGMPKRSFAKDILCRLPFWHAKAKVCKGHPLQHLCWGCQSGALQRISLARHTFSSYQGAALQSIFFATVGSCIQESLTFSSKVAWIQQKNQRMIWMFEKKCHKIRWSFIFWHATYAETQRQKCPNLKTIRWRNLKFFFRIYRTIRTSSVQHSRRVVVLTPTVPNRKIVKNMCQRNGKQEHFKEKTILFLSGPLPAACSERPRSSKSILFKRILKKKRYFFCPGRSRPPAPTGPGAQNRYFLKGF